MSNQWPILTIQTKCYVTICLQMQKRKKAQVWRKNVKNGKNSTFLDLCARTENGAWRITFDKLKNISFHFPQFKCLDIFLKPSFPSFSNGYTMYTKTKDVQ